MTNRDAHIQFKVLLDKSSVNGSFIGTAAFLPKEIDIFLNKAQYEILSDKFSGHTPLGVRMEGDRQRMSELDKLIKTDSNLIATNTKFNEFIIPNIHGDNNERMIILNVDLFFQNSHISDCLFANHDFINNYKQTYHNTPWVPQPMVVLEDNKMLLYVDPVLMQTDGYKPTNSKYNVAVTYLKKPKAFNYTQLNKELDLPDDVIMEIIDRAVLIALDNIESPRVNTKVQLDQLSE